ncbi:hypothetical protein ANN_02380 [Periplaneta americana]|uniref:Uncharacterized protein n=1 Tax=Periplaneta americana TaxID=6978 RepID=A0ABQ8U0C2_PERAM|nr:hypothetical protein ANN_02380 [Periplaneta americana]
MQKGLKLIKGKLYEHSLCSINDYFNLANTFVRDRAYLLAFRTKPIRATASVLKKHGGGRRTSDEIIANVQAAYERSPRKSLRRASRELQVPKSTLQRIVHKRLKLYA